MKVRNGFVSNSSSSSFILAYDKTGVISDAEKIVDYVDNNLRKEVFFRSDACLCDGDDIFSLDMHQKNYLLKHKKRFIKYNKDDVPYTDYSADKDKNGEYPVIMVSPVIALTKVYEFYPYPYEYDTPEVDMSDVPFEDVSLEESISALKGEASPEEMRRVKISENWLNIKYERERKARQEMEKSLISNIKERLIKEGADPDNLEVEVVPVDYRSCDPDGSYGDEFSSRYFGLEDDSYYESVSDPDLEDEEEE